MSLLDWLFRKTASQDIPQPGQADSAPPDDLLDEFTDDDDDDANSLLPVENVFCEIVYTDAGRQTTQRGITLLSVRAAPPVTIYARCHLRNAFRAFRVDRISEFITADGEVFDSGRFFTEILSLPAPDTTGAGRKPGLAGPADFNRALRDLLMAPLTVLVACGKTDGNFHRLEVDRIMSWAEDEALHLARAGLLPRDQTIEEADAMGRMIAAMRPRLSSLRMHMERTLSMDAARLSRFRAALIEVIHADDLVHAQEIAFLAEFDALADAARRAPGHLRAQLDLAAARADAAASTPAAIVFTGRLQTMTRAVAAEAARARGHQVLDRVPKSRPDLRILVVAGDGAGEKLQSARAHDLTVIGEDAFRTMMGLA